MDSINDGNGNGMKYDGEPVTIKGPIEAPDFDSHELETIRPYQHKPPMMLGTKPMKPPARKTSTSVPQRPESPVKVQAEHKFVIPSRPATLYREQSIEDYSDLFVENDSVFDRKLIRKVGYNTRKPMSSPFRN